MKDSVRAKGQAAEDVSRQDLYDDYEKRYLQLCAQIGPCREAWLLEKAARYLGKEPETAAEAFTVFPFHRALSEGTAAPGPNPDCRKQVSALQKAAELLETLCVNLYLQPWKKEIRTLKTFTGPFVYFLLPALSSSTLQSVLASIGYLPHTDPPQSEYRLSEDADPDRAVLLGFELLLARVQCSHLLELCDKDELGQQEWQEMLQKVAGPKQATEPTAHQEEETEKKEKGDMKEVPQLLNTQAAVNPVPKPRRRHPVSVDQSIMEMQLTYPDLAFRGRPLLPDKRHRASSCRSHRKAPNALEQPSQYLVDSSSGGATLSEEDATDNRIRPTGGAHGALKRHKAASLRLKLRSTAITERATDQNPASPGPSSLSAEAEEQELRGLQERMGQLHVQDTKGEVEARERDESRRGEENMQGRQRMLSAVREGEDKHQRSLVNGEELDTQRLEGRRNERLEAAGAEEEQLAQSYVMVEHQKK